MTTSSERKFVNLRKRLDQLGYRQPLGIETLPLVEKLFSDLVHTTESLRNAKLSSGKTEKESKNVDSVLEPYRTENARLVQENNKLHQELLRLKEESDQQIKDLKYSIRKLEHDTADLKFLNNQYVHKVRSLEKESKAKTEKILHLQEKNLQAVVQTPGGKKRNIPFRRQRMQIDQAVPPSGIASAPQIQTEDPYHLDLLNVADDRIMGLQDTVNNLKAELDKSDREMRKFQRQVEARDEEIERLNRTLEGGRPHDVISLEAKSKSNERLIAHLNLQVEYLQRTNCDLEKQMKELLEKKSEATNEVVNLSTKNEHLCNELNEIDHLAQQLQRDKEIALEIADKEIQEAKDEIKKQHQELEGFEETIARLTRGILETSDFNTQQMEQQILQLGNKVYELDNECFSFKKKVASQMEDIAALEEKNKLQSQKLLQTSDDTSYLKAELNSVRLQNEHLEKSLTDAQHRLSMKTKELQAFQDRVARHEERLGEFSRQTTAQREEVSALKSTVSALDQEKDCLQEAVDDKTEKIATLEDNLANREKALTNMKITVTELESALDLLNNTLSNRDREINSLRRQLDSTRKELEQVEQSRDNAFKENRCLQDDLAQMTRENQAISSELEQALHEKDDFKSRVHNYINEVARIESLMVAKEQELHHMLEQFRLATNQAENWEHKAHQAEGESSSIRLELLSVDTERRHLEEKVVRLEREIQEHMSAQQAYEKEVTNSAKSMSKLEEELRQTQAEKSRVLGDLSAIRDLCAQLDSNKDTLSRQLTSKNMEHERAVSELEDVKAENELIKKQLSSERVTIKNLETLLTSTREKELQCHLIMHEKESEIQLLADKLSLAESKVSSQNHDLVQLRSKSSQLQTELDLMKRQITTERFERERAIQEMRHHGLSTTVSSLSPLRTSGSPLCHSRDACSPK
ncbi:centrosomal protein of 135 kDa isoform X5 [Hypanus sabinus]|uniref:centrosomal protein of 135 kDa isoform X5 n=1 Tax=Hypanus sabinus TaxID=79690 RepID=UPI0028C3D323|nr:centrosomal protein of 135 kDa isoform X5 [Hypanus sabinus]